MISEHGTVLIPASGDTDLQAINSTAKCLSSVNEVRGKSQAKSCRVSDQRTRYKVDQMRQVSGDMA
jgi:hypothetical protein